MTAIGFFLLAIGFGVGIYLDSMAKQYALMFTFIPYFYTVLLTAIGFLCLVICIGFDRILEILINKTAEEDEESTEGVSEEEKPKDNYLSVDSMIQEHTEQK